MKMLLIILLIILGSQHASGVEVVVVEGVKSVLLPCQVPADVTSDFSIMLWGCEELSKPTVHMCLQSGDCPFSGQNPRYTNRTSMKADAGKTGDLSLTLRNPTVSDSGTYTCIIRKDDKDLSRIEVQLKVKEPPPFGLIVVGAFVLVLGGVICFIVYRVKERQKSTAVGQLTAVEVMEEALFVLLPCKPTCPVCDISKVEWIMVKNKDKSVCLFENDEIQPNEDYSHRTEMNTHLLRETEEIDQLNQPEADFTLTLKNPVCADGGVYICMISGKDKNTLEQKVVPLVVKEICFHTVHTGKHPAVRDRSDL